MLVDLGGRETQSEVGAAGSVGQVLGYFDPAEQVPPLRLPSDLGGVAEEVAAAAFGKLDPGKKDKFTIYSLFSAMYLAIPV